MNYLVTGAAGFIGSNLVGRLLKDGHWVYGIDSLITGKTANLKRFSMDYRFSFVPHDINKIEKLKTGVLKTFDGVFHQGALGSVPRSFEDPKETFKNNVEGTNKLFSACIDAGIKSIVFASSSSVYGNNPDFVKFESKTGQALSPYAKSKQECEELSIMFADKINSIGLRYFNVYGPNQSKDGPYAAVIAKWVETMMQNQECGVYGDGHQTRDFTYVKDVVEANVLAMNKLHGENPKDFTGFYNIGTGTGTKLLELHEILVDIIKPQSKSIYSIGERQGDVKFSIASINKAKELLNYSPKFNLRGGLIDWLSGLGSSAVESSAGH